ncbi:hypothetical protein AA81_08810 [Petrotoga halophila DSM 16923]|jgi:hypothetical protein|uniref:Uncharacterized protein n=1 Tax=Petrotoga halophila DSM 16923 TaxID=1122953 RepID=A0A2S5EGA7_9BACT|nr:hypothetical protein AA81_08810 [Petrotoga halophila DSM 16923]
MITLQLSISNPIVGGEQILRTSGPFHNGKQAGLKGPQVPSLKTGGPRGERERSLFLMGGLRGEGAQITTKRSLQKNVLKGSQGGALSHQGLRDRRSLP